MPGTQSGATITTAALTAPATFTVTGTNAAGCSDTATIFVNVTATPVAAISASPATVCAGGISTLTASGNGTYLWSPSGSSSSSIVTPPLSSPANYTLTVSNGSCSDTATTLINVNSFSASITVTNNDSIICLGDIATLNASAGISYLWNTSPPQTSQNISVNPTISTMYVVTITGSGGCMGSDSVYIQVVPTPTPTISSSATTVCAGDAVTLTAGGGTTYSWTSGPATATYIVNPVSPTNNYQVTVFTGGCSAMTSVNIFTNPLPNISATANSNAICLGDSAILTASGNATNFNWAQGGPNPNVVFPTGTSTYTVIGTDANSCSNIATVSVTLNTIYVDAGPDITICPGYTADLNAIVTGSISTVTYLWSPDTLLNNPAVQNPSASPVDSVTQFVVQVSNGNCSAKDSVLVYSIRTPDCIIHVYNGITPNSDHDNATWIIDGISSFPDNKVLIFNRWGTKIWGANGYNNKDVVWKGTDEHNRALPDGTYYYMIELYDGQGGTIYSESKWVEVTH
jgi:gliding motility-associated-like protein